MRRMRELYEDDELSMDQIAKRLDIPKSTVRNQLIAAGTKLRSKSDARRLASPRLAAYLEAFYRLHPAPKHTEEARAKMRAAWAARRERSTTERVSCPA
jgi:DNA-binding NarL/FixJ family response regulator